MYNTLKHLDILAKDINTDYEVIVIDNASNDNPELIFNDFLSIADRKNLFNFYSQSQKGKDFALKLGVEKAKKEWILICDDDNWLMPNYLLVAASLIDTYKDCFVFGGKSIPVFSENTIVPNWFEINSLRYACGEQYTNSGYVTYRQDLWGAGCIFKKEVLKLALLSTELILSNKRGEDTELFYRIMILGHKAFYSNELVFRHYIPSNRLKTDYFNAMIIIDEKSKVVLRKYNQFIKYYINNPHKKFSKFKWTIIGFLLKIRFTLNIDLLKVNLMLNIFTSFENDNDFIKIKNYYTAVKKGIK